jgi:hypothetical protein
MKTERALSDIMAIVLIIFLVIVLALVTLALFFGNFHLQPKSSYILPEVSNQTFYSKNIFIIFHRGGDPVYLGSAAAGGQNLMGVYIDTKTNISPRVVPDASASTLKPGNTLYLYNTTTGFRMTANPAMLQYPNASAITACPLSIRLVDETAKLLIGQWNYTDCDVPVPTGPAPTVTSINATTGYRGWPIVESIAGTNFLPGARAKFNRSDGAPEISASACAYISSKQLICTFDLKGQIPSNPRYNVVVTNPDGKQGMLKTAFTLSSPAPTLTSSTPATGKQGTTVIVTRLRGTYFQPDAVVVYANGTTAIPLAGAVVVNSTSITGTLVIPANAPAGPYSVTVTNTDLMTVTRANLFTVTSNAPTITSITPTTGNQGWPVLVTINGANYVSTPTAKLNSTAYADIPATSCSYVSAARIICSFNLLGKDASPPAYNMVVTNPDGKQAMRANAFTLNNPVPVLSARAPTSGNRGWPVTITSLTGTGFQPGATVLIRRAGYLDVVATGVNVASGTSINAGTLNLLGVTAGSWYYVVVNPDGKASTSTARTFTVNSNAPTIPAAPAFSPAAGARGTTGLSITAPGTYLQPGMTVVLTSAGAPTTTITAYNVNVGSPTSVTFTIDIPAGATTGAYTARYTNTDTKTVTRTSRFTVT